MTFNGQTNSYDFDPRGNRVSQNVRGAAISATFDAQDRLIRSGDLEFTYTNHGDLQKKKNLNTNQEDRYGYDVYGQLKSVALANGNLVSYLTNGRRLRFAKLVNGTIQRGYFYDEFGRLIAEVSPSGQIESRFVYTPGSHSPEYMIKNGVNYTFAKDHLGSIRFVINATDATIAQRIDYDEWGVVLQDTNPGFQPFGFAGGHYDADTKLVRFGARDYDPETGRWTSKDPILFAGGQFNLYGYVLNDPINRIDPKGLAINPDDIGDIANKICQKHSEHGGCSKNPGSDSEFLNACSDPDTAGLDPAFKVRFPPRDVSDPILRPYMPGERH